MILEVAEYCIEVYNNVLYRNVQCTKYCVFYLEVYNELGFVNCIRSTRHVKNIGSYWRVHCTVLYRRVHCTVLYRRVHCTILYRRVHCIVLYRRVHCTVLYRRVQCYIEKYTVLWTLVRRWNVR